MEKNNGAVPIRRYFRGRADRDYLAMLTFGTWNLGTDFGRAVPEERLVRQTRFLASLPAGVFPDMLALQEVAPSNYFALFDRLVASELRYGYAAHSAVSASDSLQGT
jgi:hypothetical protein